MYWTANSNHTHWYPIQKVDAPARVFCVYKLVQADQWYISTKYMGQSADQHIGPYKSSAIAMQAAEMLHEQGAI